MIELRQLQYFRAVASSLHFGRAAEELGVAPSTLSHGIHGLESELGVRLFARNSRRVRLTDAGHELAASLPAALRHLENVLDRARTAASGGWEH